MKFKYMSRKDSILISAIDIMEEKGIVGMTTKEIALREGITEPAIYRQYKGKKEIVLAVLEKFAGYDDQIMSTVDQQNMNSIDAIRYFLVSLSDYYEGYPQVVTAMFSLDVFWYDENTKKLMIDIINKRLNFLEKYVRLGLEEKSFNIDLDSKNLTEMIYGYLMNTTFNWKILSNKDGIKANVLAKFESLVNE